MKLLESYGGLELEPQELDVWARANVRFYLSTKLREDALKAVATEHTAPKSEEDSETRRIPKIDFERAHQMLGQLASNYEGLLKSGSIDVSQVRRTRGRNSLSSSIGSFGALLKTRTSMKTALELQKIIETEIYPEQSVDNSAA